MIRTSAAIVLALVVLVQALPKDREPVETRDGCCRVDTNPTLDDVRRCGCDYKDTYMYTEGDADDDGNIASEEDDAPEEADEPNRRKRAVVVSSALPFQWWWCYMRIRTYHLWPFGYLRDYYCYGSCPGARVINIEDYGGQVNFHANRPCKCCDFRYYPWEPKKPLYCRCM